MGAAHVAEHAGSLASICVQQQVQQQQQQAPRTTTDLSAVLNNTVAELSRGLMGLFALAAPPPVRVAADCLAASGGGEVVLASAGAAADSRASEGFSLASVGCGGSSGNCTLVRSSSDAGVLYGMFALLRRLQTGQGAAVGEALREAPACRLRLWDLWDNTDESIERGYAGKSVFNWSDLGKGIVSARYSDYARLLASVGLNGAAFLNVNACGHGNDALLGDAALAKLAVVARIFAGWGVQFYLTPCFASPIKVGGLATADPNDAAVRAWWATTALTLRARIPTFRGLLIKADSEGDPGPATYGRNQSEGANMLAAALAPVGGTVLWRAFEYGGAGDRATLAYKTFLPYDGEFLDNVVLQVKNGPLDFQAREAVSTLFGAGLTSASGAPLRLLLELQSTQEYLGQGRALAQLATQWEYYLGFPLASPYGGALRDVVAGAGGAGMAAVSNFGADADWAGGGAGMAMANAYAFGRLAWDPALAAAAVLGEWVPMTWGLDGAVREEVLDMSLSSWRVFENYTSPLGVGWCEGGDHFSPGPDARNSAYLHADASGIGYDRTTTTGSGYIGQYPPATAALFEDLGACPQEQLLFMHHVAWNYTLRGGGASLIDYLYASHGAGVTAVAGYGARWAALAGRPGMDDARHAAVASMLRGQLGDAQHWCSAMASFFEAKSGIKPQQGASALCAPSMPPTPVPPPIPPSDFTEVKKAFCSISGTSAKRVYDQKGVTQAQCEAGCAADAACTCFDFKDSSLAQDTECRYIEGKGKVKASDTGKNAFTRKAASFSNVLH